MENKKKSKNFSVLMSVYKNDNPLFFQQAVESCFYNQTLKPTEIIIVEDGPLTSELYDMVDKLKLKFNEIISVKLDNNMGLGNALRIGLENCTNEIVARLDSDDINAPNRFKVQIEEFEKNPRLDVLGTYIEEFDKKPGDMKLVRTVPLKFDSIRKFLKKRNPMNHVTVMMKKSSVLDVGNYESVLYVEDYYLWIKLVAAKKNILNIPNVGVFVRTGNNMYGRRGNKEYIKSWSVLQQLMYKEHMINRLDMIFNMVMINIFIRIPSSLKKSIYRNVLRRGSNEN